MNSQRENMEHVLRSSPVNLATIKDPRHASSSITATDKPKPVSRGCCIGISKGQKSDWIGKTEDTRRDADLKGRRGNRGISKQAQL